ncbi:hypothetical protein [Nocardioides dilutus]
MRGLTNHLGGRAVLVVAGGFGGLVLAVIVVLNLHILVGLEEGYAASPQEVWHASVFLAVVDVAVLVAGPLLGALIVGKLLRRPTPRSPRSS